MALTKRKVIFNIFKPDGSPLANLAAKIIAERTVGSGGETVLGGIAAEFQLDQNGHAEVQLEVFDDGTSAVKYQVIFSSYPITKHNFDLVSGADVNFDLLYNINNLEPNEVNLVLTAFDQKIDSSAVRFDAAQSLDANQQAQARANIGATAGSGTNDVNKIAGENLGGQRVVISSGSNNVLLADSTNLAHKNLIMGITLGAAMNGSAATIRTAGEMFESSWNWTPGVNIYLGANGLLTQIPPTTGFLKVIGVALTATLIRVQIQPTIILI